LNKKPIGCSDFHFNSTSPKSGLSYLILVEIINDDPEKFRLNFSRCANRGEAPLSVSETAQRKYAL